MGGAATVVCLQQLKGMLGLEHFTTSTDLVSVMRSVFSQTHQWRWESVVLGCGFLFFLLVTRFFSKRQPRFFWVSAAAPLTSVILGSLLVYFTHAENHGVQIIGNLKKGLNPISVTNLQFTPPYMMLALKTGLITGVIALAEGIAVGRSFAMFKNYHIDGNKEMIAIGTMNILGSFTSCYLTTGPFSRSAVNYNAGCKTAMSNVVMSLAVMVTLLFLTPLFHYTPLVVLSAIIMSAMLGLIDFPAAVHLWHVDKVDFCVCAGAYLGVVFGSVEMGLVVAVAISVLRVLLFVARPRTTVLGNVPDTNVYRRMDQYTTARAVPGVLVLRVDSPIYFANSGYLRERFTRWIDEDDERTSAKGETGVQYVVLDMGGKLQQLVLKQCLHLNISNRASLKLVLSARSCGQHRHQRDEHAGRAQEDPGQEGDSDRAGEPGERDHEEAGQLQGAGAHRPRVDLPDGGRGRGGVRLRAALPQAGHGGGRCLA
ncbi:hypothetical protein VPH35_064435 [Triticum aestivum]